MFFRYIFHIIPKEEFYYLFFEAESLFVALELSM